MPKATEQKSVQTLDVDLILSALSDPTRRQIVMQLANKDFCCGSFDVLGPKTRLTYHFARLVKAGLITSSKEGRFRILSLRLKDVEAAFPGVLTSILQASRPKDK